ncbi:alpha/beta fold hydrolase [Mycobacteroides abscessus]|uniref:alpha/beta fold hydrolase n=1 Tax=Mycobacteroides abscessus TaxID=36809 RepID=UPI001F3B92D4|nr:alpha/beta hydrolase [Mycobacteroides abscessus]
MWKKRSNEFQCGWRCWATGEGGLCRTWDSPPSTKAKLFIENTPRRSYTARVTSVLGFDFRGRLGQVDVPTLIVTPQDDKLVGENAAKEMLAGISGAREVILPKTGHMFRFTHPDLYGRTIVGFIDDAIIAASPSLQGDGGR